MAHDRHTAGDGRRVHGHLLCAVPWFVTAINRQRLFGAGGMRQRTTGAHGQGYLSLFHWCHWVWAISCVVPDRGMGHRCGHILTTAGDWLVEHVRH
jgi:hypothetical protein